MKKKSLPVKKHDHFLKIFEYVNSMLFEDIVRKLIEF